jgi:hypothetical protein
VNYYESLAALRQRLAAAGESGCAEVLLQAERGGTTSSEILAETGIVLRRLLETGAAERLQMVADIEALDRLGRDLFKSTNPKW